MTLLPQELYDRIEASMPLTCVDFVSFRSAPDGTREVSLIERESPFGVVWCHLGGRIMRGETVEQALRRHAFDTLGVSLTLPHDPQPGYVQQWFPPEIMPDPAMSFGEDPRKHAVGLSFAVELVGPVDPQNEALDFGWFPVDRLPEPLWPGTAHVIAELVRRRQAS